MRAIFLVTGAALTLAACGDNGQAGNTTNIDESLTAENIVSNDVTAIDAVTGDAANMAADMDVNFINGMDDGLDNAATSSEATSSEATSRKPAKPKPAPETPTSNDAAANEVANSATE